MEILPKLRRLLAEYISLTKTVLIELNDKNDWKYYQPYFQNFLQRTYYGIRSIDFLLEPFEKDTNFKFPIGIQIRTMLLDLITLSYLGSFVRENKEKEFHNAIARINALFIKDVLKELEVEFGNEDKSQVNSEITELANLFPMNFDTSGDKTKLRTDVKLINAKEMTRELIKINSIFDTVYDQYYYYSKYEHYIPITKAMLDYDSKFEFEKLLISINLIFEGNVLVFQEFLIIDNQKIEQMFNLKNKSIEFLLTFVKQFSEGDNDNEG